MLQRSHWQFQYYKIGFFQKLLVNEYTLYALTGRQIHIGDLVFDKDTCSHTNVDFTGCNGNKYKMHHYRNGIREHRSIATLLTISNLPNKHPWIHICSLLLIYLFLCLPIYILVHYRYNCNCRIVHNKINLYLRVQSSILDGYQTISSVSLCHVQVEYCSAV